jgi:methylmalonyl-CoA carboxyltransferase 1.3S subunit
LRLRITIDGKIYEAEVEVIEDEESQPDYDPPLPAPVSYTPTPVANPLIQPNHSGAGAADPKIFRSPLTGLVIAVNVEPGQAVEANDVLVVLEAMKMETQITAEQPGKVKSVHVSPGDSVKVHQTLVEFE